MTESPEHVDLVRRLLALPGGVRERRPFVDGGFGEDGQPLTHAARAKVVVRHAKKGQRVVRLMTGDPFLYASGPEEAQACVKAGLGFEIVPGVSSVVRGPGVRRHPADHQGPPRGRRRHRAREGRLGAVRRRPHAGGALRRQHGRRHRQGAGRRRPRPGDPGRDDPRRHHHRAGHGHLDAGRHRRRRARRPDGAAGRDRGRQGRRPARDAVVVRDQAAVRLAGAGAAHQGPGRPAGRPAARLRRGARRGADDLGRAAPQPAADGQGRPRPGRGPLRVDRVHLGQRRQGGAREVRGVRPRRPRVLRPQDRRGRRQDRPGDRGLGPPRRPGAVGRAVRGRAAGRLAGVRRPARPDQPGLPARAPTSPPRRWSPG